MVIDPAGARVIGTAAFKGPPTDAGVVEDGPVWRWELESA